jgi:threonine aldolase
MGDCAHTYLYEAGGISALGGIHPFTIPNQADGTLLIGDIQRAVRANDPHFPRSKLLILENTHNRCGGVSLSREYMLEAAQAARENRDLAIHLDGARIFNAAVDQGVPVHRFGRDGGFGHVLLEQRLMCAGWVGFMRSTRFH